MIACAEEKSDAGMGTMKPQEGHHLQRCPEKEGFTQRGCLSSDKGSDSRHGSQRTRWCRRGKHRPRQARGCRECWTSAAGTEWARGTVAGGQRRTSVLPLNETRSAEVTRSDFGFGRSQGLGTDGRGQSRSKNPEVVESHPRKG